MAGALFNRLKVWILGETVTGVDLNNEFNNILQNFEPLMMDSYSETLTQFKTIQSPGAVASEVLPSNLAEELAVLRYMIAEIIGNSTTSPSTWYAAPVANLSVLNGLVTSSSAPRNRIISGLVNANAQPVWLVPNGAAATLALQGASTNFVFASNGTNYTISSNVSKTSLGTAASSNNTCLVNDGTLAGTQPSKAVTTLFVKTVGSAISALNGKQAAFKVGAETFVGEISIDLTTLSCTFPSSGTGFPCVITATAHGLVNNDQIIFSGGSLPTGITAGTRYYATVVNANNFKVSATLGGAFVATTSTGTGTGTPPKLTCIKNIQRGFFFDSSSANLPAVAITDGDTVTIKKLTWVFATYNSSTAAIDVTYNQPVVSYSQPTAPQSGDYWLDLSVPVWKKYDGATFNAVIAIFAGMCVQDTTVCYAARSADAYAVFSSENTLEAEWVSTALVAASQQGVKVNVYGNPFAFDGSVPQWDSASDFDGGVSLSASTTYYLYLSSVGRFWISNVAPNNRKKDLLGFYHPAKPWRCLAEVATDSGSFFTASSLIYYKYFGRALPDQFVAASQIVNSTITATQLASQAVGPYQSTSNYQFSAADSGAFSLLNTTTETLVTGMIATIACSGLHPVEIKLISNGLGDSGVYPTVALQGTTSGNNSSTFFLHKDGSQVQAIQLQWAGGSFSSTYLLSPSSICFVDQAPTAGSHKYELYAQNGAAVASQGVLVKYCYLMARELA